MGARAGGGGLPSNWKSLANKPESYFVKNFGMGKASVKSWYGKDGKLDDADLTAADFGY